MQTPKRKRYQKDTTSSDDIYTLIQLVRQNPAIYNYKLQPHRRRVDVLTGWIQIANQIGNKYTVEECRRKWKNLRDTYHQYRLRKSKQGEGLSKWRYAKDLEFLSSVYQPKLKTLRKQELERELNSQILQVTSSDTKSTINNSDEMLENHSHNDISLVNEEAETFILTAYEESVNDDELTHHHHHDDDDITEHIVKNESGSMDGVVDDGGAGNAEVDYEEVCLYEEENVPSANDCETIQSSGNCMTHEGEEPKHFQYLDPHDFCIDEINAHEQLHTHIVSDNGGGGGGGTKLKSIMSVVNGGGNTCEAGEITTVTTTNSMDCTAMSAPLIQFEAPERPTDNGHIREELDLFFDFLKKKIQHFSKEEISAIQIDILNCVLRREAESAQKFGAAVMNGRSQ